MPISLNTPTRLCNVSIFDGINSRRSVRSYSPRQLTFQELSDLLFYTCGKTGEKAHQKSAPSAGGIHALSVYAVVGEIDDIESGIYKFNPAEMTLDLVRSGDNRPGLAKACYNQKMIPSAPLTILIAVDFGKIRSRYEGRETRYGAMDCGHYGQNIYLCCEALRLATVAVGAFSDTELIEFMSLPENEVPYYLFPVGAKK